MKISIIIPTYNEENTISELLKYLKIHSEEDNVELIVVDGKSNDRTVEKAREAGLDCIISKKKSRAVQMNTGAEHSTGDILYFVHADSFPPETFPDDILQAVNRGVEAGCYRLRFDSNHPLLGINAFFTRFDRLIYRGGDQTLFVTRSLFDELGGYNEDYVIMEDFELIERLRAKGKFAVIPKEVIVSARKYRNNSYVKVNFINFFVFALYFLGASQQTLVHIYSKLIDYSKFGEEVS